MPRAVEFDRVWAADIPVLPSDGEFSAAVLAGLQSDDLAREFFQRFAEVLRKWQNAPWFEIIHLARGIAVLGASDLFSEELLTRVHSIFAERTENNWIAVGMAVVHYHHAQYTEAQSVLRTLRQHRGPQIAFLDAAIAWKMGDREYAQQRWAEADARYRQMCHDALVQEVADNNKGVFNEHWWQFAYGQTMRRLAAEAMSGEPVPDDPWQRLIQARGYWLIGEQEKAEEELAAAVNAAAQDVEICLARARLLGYMGQRERAEADLQRMVDAAGDDPLPWIHRGRWYASGGDLEKAMGDFNQAVTLAPEDPRAYRARSELHWRLNQWDESFADYQRAIEPNKQFVELQPGDAIGALIRVQLLLAAGRTDEYRAACLEMLERFGTAGAPGQVYHAARACTLAPGTTADPERIVAMATEAVSHSPDWPGHFFTSFGLALVHHERGETQQAREWYAKGVEFMKKHRPAAAQDWLECQLLRREVEQLLEKPDEEQQDGEPTDNQ